MQGPPPPTSSPTTPRHNSQSYPISIPHSIFPFSVLVCQPGTIRSYLARMAEAGNPLDWQRADLPSTVLPAVDTALKALQEQGKLCICPMPS